VTATKTVEQAAPEQTPQQRVTQLEQTIVRLDARRASLLADLDAVKAERAQALVDELPAADDLSARVRVLDDELAGTDDALGLARGELDGLKARLAGEAAEARRVARLTALRTELAGLTAPDLARVHGTMIRTVMDAVDQMMAALTERQEYNEHAYRIRSEIAQLDGGPDAPPPARPNPVTVGTLGVHDRSHLPRLRVADATIHRDRVRILHMIGELMERRPAEVVAGSLVLRPVPAAGTVYAPPGRSRTAPGF
jgi:hypothetical protein